MNTDVALRSRGLVRRFGAFTAVDQLDLEVPRGSIFGFLGANGAGKTTAIRMLCGLLAPSSGEAWVDGIDVVKEPDLVKARIGYMAQKFSLYDDLSVAENLEFFADAYLVPLERLADRKRAVIHLFQLEGLEHTKTKILAGGVKQRLALACSLVHEPRILFLDEPTAGVDPLSRRAFWRQIHALRTQGVTIFVTTHHLDEAENCTEVLFMKAGRTVALGSPRKLREQADHGQLVRVMGAEARALRAHPAVRELTPMGEGWQVWLHDAGQSTALGEDLGAQVERVRPSLEDVFLDAVREDRP